MRHRRPRFNRGGRFLGVLTLETGSLLRMSCCFNRGGRFLGVLTKMVLVSKSVKSQFQSRWAILGGADRLNGSICFCVCSGFNRGGRFLGVLTQR